MWQSESRPSLLESIANESPHSKFPLAQVIGTNIMRMRWFIATDSHRNRSLAYTAPLVSSPMP